MAALPLNNALTAAGDPATIDAALVRADFREDWWRGWNLFEHSRVTARRSSPLSPAMHM